MRLRKAKVAKERLARRRSRAVKGDDGYRLPGSLNPKKGR